MGSCKARSKASHRSWLTTTTALAAAPASHCSSHCTPSTLRWLVGSSRMSTSGRSTRMAASATRFFCPPLSVAASRSSKAPQPSLSKMAFASASLSHACEFGTRRGTWLVNARPAELARRRAGQAQPTCWASIWASTAANSSGSSSARAMALE
eukprot:scaffold571_cov364-Prasinococcus_capsulatus_cf.AAC.5